MEKILRYNGKQMAYTTKGNGPAVMLVHGFLEDGQIWTGMANSLASAYKVIIPDLPGFGKSEMLSAIHGMSLMAQVVTAILDQENVTKALLIGHSMGGYVGAAMADQFPERLSGLVFFHSHAAADEPEVRVNRDRTINLVNENRLKFILSFIPLLFDPAHLDWYNDQIAVMQKRASTITAEAVVAALAGMRDRGNHLYTISKVPFPVMFIVGKQDSRITMDKIMAQVSLPANSEVLILDSVGHMGFVEAPETTTMAIRGFAQRIYKQQHDVEKQD